MAYTPGIPQNGQSLGSSRDQVRNNFTSLFDTIAQNHEDPSDANAGKHTVIELVAQSSDPSTPANIIDLYSKQVSGEEEIFFRRQNDGSIIQMSIGDPSRAATGQSFLPGGLIIQWGLVDINTTAITTGTFNTPFQNAVYSIQLTYTTFVTTGPASSRAFLSGGAPYSTFTVQTKVASGSASATNGAYYLAIGY